MSNFRGIAKQHGGKLYWFGSHKNLEQTFLFKNEASRIRQMASWKEAYWLCREANHRLNNSDAENKKFLSCVMLMTIVAAVIPFLLSLLGLELGNSSIIYWGVIAIVAIAVAAIRANYTDYQCQLAEWQLEKLEIVWPGIVNLAMQDSINGVRSTPPPLDRTKFPVV